MLRKIISGGQTGADHAGLVVGKRFGLATGGTMPKGHKTLIGPKPDWAAEFGLAEHTSDNYVPRTYQNVQDADATVRLAGNFQSRGEICTLEAIKEYKKPYFDVQLDDPPAVAEFVKWLRDNNVTTLNVAGNAEQTFLGAFRLTARYLSEAMLLYGLDMMFSISEIVEALGLDPAGKVGFANGAILHRIAITRFVPPSEKAASEHMEVQSGTREETDHHARPALDGQEHAS